MGAIDLMNFPIAPERHCEMRSDEAIEESSGAPPFSRLPPPGLDPGVARYDVAPAGLARRERRYPAKPSPAKPTSIIAQVEGSGTGASAGLYSTQPGPPSSTSCNRSNASVK
jgi:hypothetical protein